MQIIIRWRQNGPSCHIKRPPLPLDFWWCDCIHFLQVRNSIQVYNVENCVTLFSNYIILCSIIHWDIPGFGESAEAFVLTSFPSFLLPLSNPVTIFDLVVVFCSFICSMVSAGVASWGNVFEKWIFLLVNFWLFVCLLRSELGNVLEMNVLFAVFWSHVCLFH